MRYGEFLTYNYSNREQQHNTAICKLSSWTSIWTAYVDNCFMVFNHDYQSTKPLKRIYTKPIPMLYTPGMLLKWSKDALNMEQWHMGWNWNNITYNTRYHMVDKHSWILYHKTITLGSSMKISMNKKSFLDHLKRNIYGTYRNMIIIHADLNWKSAAVSTVLQWVCLNGRIYVNISSCVTLL